MKTFPVLFLMFIVCACNSGGESIEGSYVRTFQNEYAFGVDTITIEHIGKENAYIVHKNSGYRRIVNGKIAEAAEYHHAQWIALYDDKTGALTTDPNRKVIGIQVNGETLQLGSSIYKKGN